MGSAGPGVRARRARPRAGRRHRRTRGPARWTSSWYGDSSRAIIGMPTAVATLRQPRLFERVQRPRPQGPRPGTGRPRTAASSTVRTAVDVDPGGVLEQIRQRLARVPEGDVGREREEEPVHRRDGRAGASRARWQTRGRRRRASSAALGPPRSLLTATPDEPRRRTQDPTPPAPRPANRAKGA